MDLFDYNILIIIFQATAKENKDFYKTAKSIHEFSVLDIDGNEVSLDKYK